MTREGDWAGGLDTGRKDGEASWGAWLCHCRSGLRHLRSSIGKHPCAARRGAGPCADIN
jgi:hypothetical protein